MACYAYTEMFKDFIDTVSVLFLVYVFLFACVQVVLLCNRNLIPSMFVLCFLSRTPG